MLKSRVILIFAAVSFLSYSIFMFPLSAAPRSRRSLPSPPLSPPPSPPAPVFELFVLALTWPGSFCDVRTCWRGNRSKYQKFTLHGLWPSNHTGTQPESCLTAPETIDWLDQMMNPLKASLEANWPDLKESNTKFFTFFWQIQWNKHGSCSTMGHYDYFNNALKIYADRDLLPILQSDKKTRPGGNPVQYKDVFNAIWTGIGKMPQIICETKDYQKWYIVEVRLCLDKNKVIGGSMEDIYIDCPIGKPCPVSTVYLS